MAACVAPACARRDPSCKLSSRRRFPCRSCAERLHEGASVEKVVIGAARRAADASAFRRERARPRSAAVGEACADLPARCLMRCTERWTVPRRHMLCPHVASGAGRTAAPDCAYGLCSMMRLLTAAAHTRGMPLTLSMQLARCLPSSPSLRPCISRGGTW